MIGPDQQTFNEGQNVFLLIQITETGAVIWAARLPGK